MTDYVHILYNISMESGRNIRIWDNLRVRFFANIYSSGYASCFRAACQIDGVPEQTISRHSISNNTCHDFSRMDANCDLLCVKLQYEREWRIKWRKFGRINFEVLIEMMVTQVKREKTQFKIDIAIDIPSSWFYRRKKFYFVWMAAKCNEKHIHIFMDESQRKKNPQRKAIDRNAAAVALISCKRMAAHSVLSFFYIEASSLSSQVEFYRF